MIEDQLSNPDISAAALTPRNAGIRGWKLATGVMALFLVSMLPILVRHLREEAPEQGGVIRFEVPDPSEVIQMVRCVVSPDGRKIAFTSLTAKGSVGLWVRPLDSLKARELPVGQITETLPFWAPDSRSIGFAANGKFKSINTVEGTVETLGSGETNRLTRTTWGSGGDIIFGNQDGIFRLSMTGGAAAPLVKLAQTERAGTPTFLPDGRHFLYRLTSPEKDRTGVFVGSLDGGDPVHVRGVDSAVQYASGFLLFNLEGDLVARPFDLTRFQVTGELKRIAQLGVSNQWSASHNGVLAYTYGSSVANSQILWYDRSGKQIALVGEPGRYSSFDLSPDGSSIAVGRQDPNIGSQNLQIVDAARGTMRPLTLGAWNDVDPRWSTDGKELIFGSTRGPNPSPFRIAASGGQATPVIEWKTRRFALDAWSPDGKLLLYHYSLPGSKELWAIPFSGDRKPFLVLRTLSGNIDQAQFSPDGRWIAFNANESGRFEVWVMPFPPADERWQISTDGGLQPRWSGNGRELFYLTLNGTLTAVNLGADRKISGKPHTLFTTRLQPVSPNIEQYAVSGDGQRFLIIEPAAQAGPKAITVVLNWPGQGRRMRTFS